MSITNKSLAVPNSLFMPITAARIEAMAPSAYRLGSRNGVHVLQGRFDWTEGRMHGHEWRDLPTVDLDAEGGAA